METVREAHSSDVFSVDLSIVSLINEGDSS